MTSTGQRGSAQGGTTMSIGGPLGDGHLSAQVQIDSTGAPTLFGRAPGVAHVEIVDSAGRVLGSAAATGGWFLLALPADPPTTATTGTGNDTQTTSGTAPA